MILNSANSPSSPPTDDDQNRARQYWLILFNPDSWQDFLRHGGRLVGFRRRRWASVEQIRVGDYLLCYLLGVSRWVAALRVVAPPYCQEATGAYVPTLPVRVAVKSVVNLQVAELAIPLMELKPQLSIFTSGSKELHWTAPLRRSPARWPQRDGERVLEALIDAKMHPVVRELRRWRRPAKPYPTLAQSGLEPTGEDLSRALERTPEEASQPLSMPPEHGSSGGEYSPHTEMQWLLLKLGNDMGLDVWVARNDRGRRYHHHAFESLPRLLARLPQPFDPATRRIVEHIDALWLQGNAIVAAFEIESTTTIYSGLLRMADLVAMQPNLKLALYIVAPDERRAKVIFEVNRPVFRQLQPPLAHLCRYLSFSALRHKAVEVEAVLPYLRPTFIDQISECCRLDAIASPPYR